jgi:hypothetical protein
MLRGVKKGALTPRCSYWDVPEICNMAEHERRDTSCSPVVCLPSLPACPAYSMCTYRCRHSSALSSSVAQTAQVCSFACKSAATSIKKRHPHAAMNITVWSYCFTRLLCMCCACSLQHSPDLPNWSNRCAASIPGQSASTLSSVITGGLDSSSCTYTPRQLCSLQHLGICCTIAARLLHLAAWLSFEGRPS